jgi:hypothetical protein
MNRAYLFALCAALAYAGDVPKPKIELPGEVQPIVDLARSAAPEVFADAIVRLIEGGRIPQREAQIELLQDAFAVASSAAEPIRLIALPTTPSDTRELYRSRAGELGLDALSLQSRILKEMLTVDPMHARQLFSAIPRPVLDPRPCEDPFVADDSAYFEIAAGIAQSGFSADEKKQAAHVQFLAAILAGIRSPNELAPYARALESVSLNPTEWALLGAAFAEKLNTMATDYRPFAMSFDALDGEMRTLEQVSQVAGLRDAFRKYAVTQLTAPRCGPDLSVDTSGLGLSSEETNPSKRNGSIKSGEAYFSSGDGKLIGEKLTKLQSMRQSPEFHAAFADFLRDFQSWQPSGSDADVLHQRATVVGALLQLPPPSDDRRGLLSLCASMLASSGAQKDAPAEWIWQAHRLAETAGADASALFALYRSSGDPALSVYGYVLNSAGPHE